jgi:hypothetical protein
MTREGEEDMQLRRTTALAAGALLVAVPLSSWRSISGLNAATTRVYTPAAGTNNRDAAVDVLNAVIVSARPGSGTFIATFANNSATDAASVTALAAAGDTNLGAPGFTAIDIPARGAVNLAADGQGVPVQGDLTAGTFVDIALTFGDGESVTMSVPVVPDDREFSGLDTSSPS